MEEREKEAIWEVTELDPNFKYEIAKQPGGEHIKRCYACGTCTAGCPVTDVDSEYSPRQIIRRIILGMRKEVLSSGLIWLCALCYRCYARCPQEVNFTDVMRVLRYLAIKENYAPLGIWERVKDIDRFTYSLRRELVDYLLKGREGILEQVRSKMEEALRRLAKGETIGRED